MVKLPTVGLACVDCTSRAALAAVAIEETLKHCEFGDVRFFTSSKHNWKHKVEIPHINSLDDYSRFVVKDLWHYYADSKLTHVLVIQSDGYVLDGNSWNNSFLGYDYIGAPWLPSGVVGNGGFSLRSLKLLKILGRYPGNDVHPEDSFICGRFRVALEAEGISFAPREIAERFSFEGRSWHGQEWSSVPTAWNGQFGFHSWLSVLPHMPNKPLVFHHTGDYGDAIYGMAVMRQVGGGVLFLSDDNRFPYPMKTRAVRTLTFGPMWVDNLKPMVMDQPYVWNCLYTHGLPYSTDYDLNKFRLPWKERTAKDTESIINLHFQAFGLTFDGQPWLSVRHPIHRDQFPIVANLTQRYRSETFPWFEICQKYHDKILFVGTDQEAELFQGFAVPRRIAYQPTLNLHEMARVIAGANLFIGNQSAAMAIAIGMGKRVICDEWPLNPNCRIQVQGGGYSNNAQHIEQFLNA